MKKIIYATVFISIISCKKSDPTELTCVNDLIESFETSSICDDAHVDEYLFQNDQVFVFENGSCGADLTSEVIDNKCNSLGTLGGITGNTEINGQDFSQATFVQTVWQK